MASDRARCGGSGGALYFFGMFGAWVYFWQRADGFWSHVLGLLEGVVWPAFVVHGALLRLH